MCLRLKRLLGYYGRYYLSWLIPIPALVVLPRLATPLTRRNSYGPLSTCTHKLLKLTFLSVSALLSVIVATILSLECCVWRDMNSNEQGCRLKHLFQDLLKLDKVTFYFLSKKHKSRLILPVKLPDVKISQPTYLIAAQCDQWGLTFFLRKIAFCDTIQWNHTNFYLTLSPTWLVIYKVTSILINAWSTAPQPKDDDDK